MKTSILLAALVGGAVICAGASADEAFSAKIQQAMQSDIRSDDEKARDDNRRPVETLEFFGLTDNMKVLELVPGGGWYTKLLAPALAENGEYYAAIGTGRIAGMADELGIDPDNILSPELTTERDQVRGQTSVAPFSFGETGFDAALTFRNMHNFTDVGRKSINNAVFEALKPGGIYGVVDHTRRHMEPHWSENRRRIDPVLVISEVIASGFEFVGYSDLHYKSDDELRFEVGRKSVTGNTDRFTLLFKKPE